MLGTGFLYTRFWLLSLFKGVENAGLSPISITQTHALAYLANALASAYDIMPLEQTILKDRDGPLYPEVIWETERLIGMCLIKISPASIESTSPQKSGEYSITQFGIQTIDKITHCSPVFARVAQAQSSIALAYARNPKSGDNHNLANLDGNYANNFFGYGEVIDFGVWEHINATLNSVRYIDDKVKQRFPHRNDPSLAVNFYTQYLAEAAYG